MKGDALMKKPQGFDLWNPAMRGAYKKGYQARMDGAPRVSPYADKRKWDGRLTWSRAFERAWTDGYDAASQDDPISAYYCDRRL
jgi:hypothetical protein